MKKVVTDFSIQNIYVPKHKVNSSGVDISSVFNEKSEVFENTKTESSDVILQDNLRNKKLSKLIDGDYSVLNEIEWRTVQGTQEFVEIAKSFQFQKGISIYDSMVGDYMNGKLSKDKFYEYLTKLLDMSEFKPDNNVSDEEWEVYGLYALFRKDLHSGQSTDKDIKNFNYNEFFEKITVPYSEKLIKNEAERILNAKKAKELSNYDVTNSQIAPLLPRITNIQINKSEKVQYFNDKKYQISYDKDKIIVKDSNSEHVIKLKKLLSNIKNEEDKAAIQKILLDLSAPVLIDIGVEIDTIKVFNDANSSTYAQYDGKDNVVSINLAKKDEKNMPFVLAHEIGHSLDFSRQDDRNKVNSGFDKELISIAEQEMIKLKDRPEYEKQYASSNPVEMFAECYALLNMGSSADSNYVIATYFPNTLKYIKEQIENQRQLPMKDRNYIGRESTLLEMVQEYIPQWGN